MVFGAFFNAIFDAITGWRFVPKAQPKDKAETCAENTFIAFLMAIF